MSKRNKNNGSSIPVESVEKGSVAVENRIEIADGMGGTVTGIPHPDETQPSVDEVLADGLPSTNVGIVADPNGDTSNDEPIPPPTASDVALSALEEFDRRNAAERARLLTTVIVAEPLDEMIKQLNDWVSRPESTLATTFGKLTQNVTLSVEWDMESKRLRYPQTKTGNTASKITATNAGNGGNSSPTERNTSKHFTSLTSPDGIQYDAPMRGTGNDRVAMSTLTGIVFKDSSGNSLSHAGMRAKLDSHSWTYETT